MDSQYIGQIKEKETETTGKKQLMEHCWQDYEVIKVFWEGTKAVSPQTEDMHIMEQQFHFRNPSWENVHNCTKDIKKHTNEFMEIEIYLICNKQKTETSKMFIIKG